MAGKVSTTVLLTAELRERLDAAAAAGRRSLAAEVQWRLEESFRIDDAPTAGARPGPTFDLAGPARPDPRS